jgi:hypothetical protein
MEPRVAATSAAAVLPTRCATAVWILPTSTLPLSTSTALPPTPASESGLLEAVCAARSKAKTKSVEEFWEESTTTTKRKGYCRGGAKFHQQRVERIKRKS